MNIKERIAYHRRRVMDHVQQIEKIKADPGYPASRLAWRSEKRRAKRRGHNAKKVIQGGKRWAAWAAVGEVLEQGRRAAEGGRYQWLRVHPQDPHAESAEEDRQREG